MWPEGIWRPFGKYSWICLIIWIMLIDITKTNFTVYWNVPSHQCHGHGIYLNASKFGIVQNTDDVFAGDKVNINYRPGRFPYIQDGEPIYGGIPQLADFENHTITFANQVEIMPQGYSGLAVLDFEHYLPCYPWAKLEYRQMSDDYIASLYPSWSNEEVKAESEKTFNSSSADLMEALLKIGTSLRPEALWGYYHYPYCKNYNALPECQETILNMNNNSLWIYNSSAAMYPSVYLYKENYDEESRKDMALKRISESKRLRDLVGKDMPIMVYCWYRYHDVDEYLTDIDLFNTIGLSKLEGVEGSVIWGSSGDVSSIEKCTALQLVLILWIDAHTLEQGD
ncbi:hypothetical protein SK128_002338 [Halocaridina rubra]|uniref:Hyaluronidase n=1 Tax=Halocaridina rubra TaxID=373956 RepID=A0AAN8XJ77_HALRR